MTLRELLEDVMQRASLAGVLDKPVYTPEEDGDNYYFPPEPVGAALLLAHVETAERQMSRVTLKELRERGRSSFAPIDGVILKLEPR